MTDDQVGTAMASAARKTVEVNNEVFADELKPGTQLLHGQFTIESFLNSGGFGITYLARDSLDRLVVIKECFPGSFCRRSNTIVGARSRAHQVEFRSIVKLFVQEAFNLSKLKHPNIVGVHQVFEDNDTAYMAMDYIEGFDLLETLEEGATRLSPDEIVGVLQKVLGAVGFVHSQGVLHRDISPDNILMDKRTGNPVLIDFGAAREEVSKASRALSAMRVVKDGYSPQEFYINGSAQGPSSDLYALAATFYHLITGQTPANSQTRLSAVASRDPDPYLPLTGNVADFSPAFLKAIDKALNVFPKDRIQSADAWLAMIAPGADEMDEPPAEKRQSSKRVISGKVAVQAGEVPRPPKTLLMASAAVFAIMAVIAGWQAGFIVDTGAVTAPGSEAAGFADGAPTDTAGQDASSGDAAGKTEIAAMDASLPTAPEKGVEAIDVSQDQPATGSELARPLTDTASVAPGVDLVNPADAVRATTLTAEVATTPEVAAQPAFTGVVEAGPETAETPAADPATSIGVDVALPDPVVTEATPQATIAESVVLDDPAIAQASQETVSALAADSAGEVVLLSRAVSMHFDVDGKQRNLITGVRPGAPLWMQPGQRIVEINGQPVRSSDDLGELMGRAFGLGPVSEVQVIFGVQAFEGADIIRKTEVLPVVDNVRLEMGLTFEVRASGDGPQTVVTSVPAGTDVDLKVGDVLIAYTETQEKFGVSTTLAMVLSREIENKVGTYRFDVERNGSMIAAFFTLNLAS